MSRCVKCGAEAIVVPRLNDGFCRDCFLAYAVHKFRASIGKARIVRDDERVLVAYSCGASSTCLLHLIREGVSRRAQKRLRFTSVIAFIDESPVLKLSIAERREIVDHAVSAIRESNFPAYAAHLEDSLAVTDGRWVDSSGDTWANRVVGTEINAHFDTSKFISRDDEDTRMLVSMFDSTRSDSAKEDLLRMLRHRLLVAMAERAGCSKVAVADTSGRMAVTLLSDLARGRGAHVSYNMGFCDDRSDHIQFFRPLKDFTSKDVAFYNRLTGYHPHSIPTLTTKQDTNASIERLTQDFVNNLQADYASTVPNIVRTGEKLEATNGDSGDTTMCSLCRCRLDTDVPLASALNSVTMSVNLRHRPSSTASHCPPENPDSPALCYGCRIVGDEMDDSGSFMAQLVKGDISKGDNSERGSASEKDD